VNQSGAPGSNAARITDSYSKGMPSKDLPTECERLRLLERNSDPQMMENLEVPAGTAINLVVAENSITSTPHDQLGRSGSNHGPDQQNVTWIPRQRTGMTVIDRW
jgi:hypothetical protein